MRKLILGIVAVLCVQIMFQTFMAVDRSDADRRAMIASGPLVGPIADAGDATADIAEPTEHNEVAPMYADSRTVSRRLGSKNIRPRQAPGSRVLPGTLDPVTITAASAPKPPAPGSNALQTSSNVVHLVTRDAPKFQKRSLIARALPVIKKPYDWLKAVASRLK